MAASMWYSKEDVLKDLAECSGNGVADFDEDFVVRGTRPPPRPKPSDCLDEEFYHRFRGCGQPQACNDIPKPDLAGITQMLRMVDGNEKTEEKLPARHKNKSPRKHNSSTEVIVISKLNPNIPEFKPKTPLSDETVKVADKNVMNTSSNDKENKIIVQENQQILEDLEKLKLIADLKSQIRQVSEHDSNEKRLKRNVAMAALVRLHSKPSGTPSSTNSTASRNSPPTTPAKNTAPVLFTPDYFAGPNHSPVVLNIDNEEQIIPEPKPLLETPLNLRTPSPRNISDPDVKESIEKVNNWLSSPKKTKPKAVLYIGDVTFKKKESKDSDSPRSKVNPKPAQISTIPSYKPSQYAVELAKDLEKRVKAKEEQEKKSQPSLNIWEKLELDLKARDEAIRRRKMHTSHNNSSGNSTPYSGPN